MNWWNDPNWVGAIGQWAGAFAGFLALIVALGIALNSNRQLQRQIRATMLPRLVIENSADTSIWSSRNGLYLAWEQPFLTGLMKNVGTGPAFNIVSIIYGSESYPGATPGKPRIPGNEVHWTCWADNELSSGESKKLQYNLGASTFFTEHQLLRSKKQEYTFHAPAIDDFQMKHASTRYIARITTTYHDIYGRKHASIFDADDAGRLRLVAFLEDISKDLHDLEENI